MIPEDHSTSNARSPVEQNEPLTPPDGATVARREESPLVAPPRMGAIPAGGTLAAPSQALPPVERWQIILGLSLAVLGGLSWIFFGFGVVNGNLLVIVLAALPALTCLAAGWLMRSWWGVIAASLVYIVVSAPVWHALSIGAPATTPDFALYVVLPALILSAIGTAIGRSRARQAELPPPHGHSAA